MFVRCPYLLTDCFGHIVTSIVETLAQHGQAMVLEAGDAMVRSNALRELPKRRAIFGIVLILPSEPRADLEALAQRGCPFVVDPRIAVPRGMVSVSAAHFSGARAVTWHLVELGHRRIGMITGPSYRHTRDHRVGGHFAALAEAGMLGDPELLRHGEPATKTCTRAGRTCSTGRAAPEPDPPGTPGRNQLTDAVVPLPCEP